MSLFDDTFDTKIGGKKSSMFAYMEQKETSNTNDVEDEDLTEEEKAAEESAVMYDLSRNSISSYKFSPSLEACDEEMEYLCMEHVSLLATLDKADAIATESYNSASSETEQQAVVEGFKETVSKYWERFKAFVIKIKNLIVRTVQRVIGYLKTLFTRVAAKVVAKLRGKDAKKMAKKVGSYNPSHYVEKVELRRYVFSDLEKLVDQVGKHIANKVGDGNVADIVGKKFDEIKAKSTSSSDEFDKYKETIEEIYDELPSKSDLVDYALGEEEEHDITKYSEDVENFVTVLRKAKIPSSVEKLKKEYLNKIDKIEKAATKSKNISSKKMSLITYVMNKIVQCLNAALAAIQQICVLWLQARIKVVNKFYNATEENPNVETESYKPSTESSIMDFYLSL